MALRILLKILFVAVFTFGLILSWHNNATTPRHILSPNEEKLPGGEMSGRVKTGSPGEAMQWYWEQRSAPAGSIPERWRERALDHVYEHNQLRSEAALSWQELGPTNRAGRVRSLAVDPSNANILYAGSVSGGIFKSTNAGSSWFPTNDFANNLVITSIVIDPSNSNIVYAGTGEGFFNSDALQGAGVLKSTNGGTSWTLLSSFTGGSFPFFINDLYIRSDNPATLCAATNTGLFRTTNSGTTWSFIHQGTSTPRGTQIVGDPGSPGIFYVCYGNFSTDGIYKTTNGGNSFSKLTSGLPSSGYQRISLAIAASNTQTLYACLASTSYFTRGIFKTTNGGSSWDSVAIPVDAVSGGTHLGGQGWYDNVIAVDPTNPAIVYTGGINLFKSMNSGTSWSMISNWYPGAGFPYVHADQHDMVFSGSTLYFCNDGGVFKTTNGGTSYTELSTGLATIQFYSGAVHPTSDIFYGGTQDNGTQKTTAAPTWTTTFGGDGGHTAVDFNTPTTVYTEYVYLNIQKTINSGTNWIKTMNGIPTSGGGPFDGASDRCLFIAPFTMDPTNPQRIAAGTYRVFHTTNGGTLWSAISTDLTGDGAGGVGGFGSSISAIAIAKTNSAVIYIGTSGLLASSRIQVTTNTGGSWANITTAPLPNRYVTRIVIDPNNADRAWAIYSGFNTNTPGTPGHIFLTTNRGVSWTNASGNLPDIPANAGVVNPANANNVIIGTDLGIFETTNAGSTWTQQNTGLANVSVADLDLRTSDNILFAATHGRGMFRSSGPLTSVYDRGDETVREFKLLQNYPNPFNPGTTIPFALPERSRVRLELYDLTGRKVADIFHGELEAGSHSVGFNASDLASGVYVYQLRTGNSAYSRKLILLR